jgi:hypothetical protein
MKSDFYSFLDLSTFLVLDLKCDAAKQLGIKLALSSTLPLYTSVLPWKVFELGSLRGHSRHPRRCSSKFSESTVPLHNWRPPSASNAEHHPPDKKNVGNKGEMQGGIAPLALHTTKVNLHRVHWWMSAKEQMNAALSYNALRPSAHKPAQNSDHLSVFLW